MDEVEKIFCEVLVLLTIFCSKGAHKAGADITHGKFAVIVMMEVVPVLLDMHLVGVETVQFHAGIYIAIHQVFQVGQSFFAKIVHFRCAVYLDGENAIEGTDIGFASAVDSHAHGLDAAFGGSHNLNVGSIRDLHNGFRVNDEVGCAMDGMLAKGVNAHAGIFHTNGAFIVSPALLPPKLNAVGARGGVAQAFAVVHPDSGFACLFHVGGADFERTKQAQL